MKFLSLLVLAAMILTSCGGNQTTSIDSGVSRQLAADRNANITYLSYDLTFSIPKQKSEMIVGHELVSLKLKSLEQPIVLDFTSDNAQAIKELKLNGEAVEYEWTNGHIIISADAIEEDYNEVEIDFIAGDQSLNRNDDYLYSLFVPDRASSAFPCFDQPDLKAKYSLELNIPIEWVGVANAPVKSTSINDAMKIIRFEESDLISTYLFSFVAGEFQSISTNINGREMTMYHRETSTDKVVSNANDIFQLHAQSLSWMEEYTSIKFPFQKFEFVLIPSFQYNGMEHTGSILYRDSSLLLERSASTDDQLSRSMLIAHETAHMWFGNLVTMKWFDDVWLKEVFANLMASKITEPNFPGINHKLNFLFSHYPDAYEVDRTEGANAIQQDLDNMKNAGSMYGSIIYHKAPIAMRQLEELMGQGIFREAMREYLENFAGKNASWNDLLKILDVKTEIHLRNWSDVWISEPGMPLIDIDFVNDGEFSEYDIVQYDLSGKGRVWPQKLDVSFSYDDGDIRFPILSDGVHYSIKKNPGTTMPNHVLLNSNALGYGIFSYGLEYDKSNFSFTLGTLDIPAITDDIKRGTSYLNLQEYLLHEGFDSYEYLRYLMDYIYLEENEQILTYLLKNLELLYWRFLTVDQTKERALEVESLLIQKMSMVSDPKIKHMLFKSFVRIAQSATGLQSMMNFWRMDSKPAGLELTESEFVLLAYNIELKSGQVTEALKDQMDRVVNPDRKKEIEFVANALSQNQEVRDAFFLSLLEPENRETEQWVNTALYYLNHPLRTTTSIEYLDQALNEVVEIQQTGDIFFPKRWLDNLLWGHNSKEAVEILSDFIEESKDMDPKLRQKVLQSADMVFRAERSINTE